MDARYIIGIDLGTTNTVVGYIDTQKLLDQPAEGVRPDVFAVDQLTAPGQVEARLQLPSFLYLAKGPEFPAGGLQLPWSEETRDFVVGELAREQGAHTPTRAVASAKSWLCHPDVDRDGPILPFEAPEEVSRVSPVEVAVRFLAHLRDGWNHRMAQDDSDLRFERQDLYLTVPASFDAAARDLTMQAAARAGLTAVTLLEEPQAAFYSWLAARADTWRDQLGVGDCVLVCDVGGGTTDFTLITVRDAAGDLELERIAVGDHILLGGDNVDLALALLVSHRLPGGGLDAWQTRSLWHACRRAKEQLLSDPTCDRQQVAILGRGSKVIRRKPYKRNYTRRYRDGGLQWILCGVPAGCTSAARCAQRSG